MLEPSYWPDIVAEIDGASEESISDEVRAAYRESSTRYLRVISTLMAFLVDAENKSLAIAIGCNALGLAFNNGESGEQIAQRFGVTRAAISKEQLKLQRALGLPPAIGQKSEESRAKFSASRKGQLSLHGTAKAQKIVNGIRNG